MKHKVYLRSRGVSGLERRYISSLSQPKTYREWGRFHQAPKPFLLVISLVEPVGK